jgi:cytochrome c5
MRKINANQTLIILIVTLLVMMMALVACGSGPATAVPATAAPAVATEAPAAADGATLLDTRCSTCHSANKIKQGRATRDQWDQLVTNMIDRGAKLSDAEKTVLVDYLAKTYGK